MGLFTPEDPEYDESQRMTGFYRYKQLLSFHSGKWFRVNLLTTLGFLPLAAGIGFSVLASSSLLLIPFSFLGGMIFGPFLAGLYDTIMRGLRDDFGRWKENYKKSWKQNLRCSLLPGGFLGLFLGFFVFMAYMLYLSKVPASAGTLALFAFSILVFLIFNTLLWPQMVLFDMPFIQRLRNILLFTAKYLWKVLGVSLLQAVWFGIIILFSPWALVIVPFLGFWYIIFLSQLILYRSLDYELKIEELFREKSADFYKETD